MRHMLVVIFAFVAYIAQALVESSQSQEGSRRKISDVAVCREIGPAFSMGDALRESKEIVWRRLVIDNARSRRYGYIVNALDAGLCRYLGAVDGHIAQTITIDGTTLHLMERVVYWAPYPMINKVWGITEPIELGTLFVLKLNGSPPWLAETH